jgi:hypothetical protein
MKNKNLLYLVLTICLPLLYTALSSNSGGRAGQSTIGCNGGGCHANNDAATILTIAGLPAGGYVGGTTYTLQATVSNSAYTQATARGGFNITCSQGTFAATTGVTASSSTEIIHDGPKAMSSGSVTWSISWTAPATGAGDLNFNFAGNACNGTGGTDGDQPNVTSIPLAEAFASSTSDIEAANIKIFPNPINDNFQVKMEEEIVNATLTLFTLTGKKISLSTEKTSSNSLQVDASQIASGIYLLNLKLNGNTYYKKVVIQ